MAVSYVTKTYLNDQFQTYSKAVANTFLKIKNNKFYLEANYSALKAAVTAVAPTVDNTAYIIGYAVSGETITDAADPTITTVMSKGFYIYDVVAATWEPIGEAEPNTTELYIGTVAPTDLTYIWVDTTNAPKIVLKMYDETEAKWKVIGGSGDSEFDEDFVTNIDCGGVKKGTQVSAGDSVMQMVKAMINAYLIPQVDFTPKSTVLEVGTSISSIDFKAVITKQSNSIVSVKFLVDGAQVHEDTTTATEGGTVSYTHTLAAAVTDADITMECQVDDGKDGATATSKYTFARKAFYGTVDTAGAVAGCTSADVRGLAGGLMSPKAGSAFSVNIPVGATKVLIAVPQGRTLKSVLYVEGMNAEVKDIFVPVTVAVEGANGYTATDYTVYEYIPAAAYNAVCTYKVTLA